MADIQRPNGKVEIRIGNLIFSAEGDQDWLAQQLSKVIEAASPAIAQAEVADRSSGGAESTEPKVAAGSLASYLKAKGGDTKQVQRFLATAGWLFRRGGKKLSASGVANALSEHHQKRLANAADCLNQNCSKGYCEKTKDGFFITPEGWKALGEEQ